MGVCAPWASIARVFRECCTMHSASSATMGQVRGQRGDTPQPDGVMDGNYHRGRAG
jgi:hypothetical protein